MVKVADKAKGPSPRRVDRLQRPVVPVLVVDPAVPRRRVLLQQLRLRPARQLPLLEAVVPVRRLRSLADPRLAGRRLVEEPRRVDRRRVDRVVAEVAVPARRRVVRTLRALRVSSVSTSWSARRAGSRRCCLRRVRAMSRR